MLEKGHIGPSARLPKLSGWVLRFVVWLLETFLGTFILERIWRKQGILGALREASFQEEMSFSPLWTLPPPDPSMINVETLGFVARAAVSAHTIPGSRCIRDTDKTSSSQRRWEIADYQQVYEAHLLSPLDVAKAVLEAIEKARQCSPPLEYLVACDHENLLKQARDSTRRYQREEPLSPLDGIPFAVIDALDASPYSTTSGTSYLAKERPAVEDAPCVDALLQTGAILVGKTLLHELGLGMSGENRRNGTPRNPYNTGCLCGGSSSGSAAIVSAGICPFALGIDGGGSVRVPAALCGVVGFKPTVGRTSHRGCPENAFSIMSAGVIATCVGDAMIVNTVISNAGTEDAERQPAPTCIGRKLYAGPPFDNASGKPLRGKRAGVYMDWAEQSSPQVLGLFLNAIRQLASTGCQVVDVEIPELESIRAAQMASVGCEIAQASKHAYSDMRKRRQMNLDTRLTLANAFNFTATDYLQAQKIRTRLMRNLEKIFQRADFLITPTVGITAPKVPCGPEEADMGQAIELMRYTIPVNMAGLPAISVPIGLTNSGLPVGIQLIGQAWREADLFFLASVIEATVGSRLRVPAMHFNILK